MTAFDMVEEIKTAKVLGAEAFKLGIECVPAFDKNLTNRFKHREVGDERTMKEIEAWISGWTIANLSS